MKHSISRRRNGGFTLVELLVVIGIIAILASVIVAGVSSALNYARRTKANSMCNQIATAVQSYYSEYGIYPTADAASGADDYYAGDDTGSNQWAPLIYALCGNQNPYSPTTGTPTPGTVPNTRNITYLTPTHSEVDTTGRLLNPFGSSVPGPYFFMVVDTDYDGVAGDTGNGAGKLIDFTNTTTLTYLSHGIPGGVAVWCSCNQPLTGTKSKPNFWAHTY